MPSRIASRAFRLPRKQSDWLQRPAQRLEDPRRSGPAAARTIFKASTALLSTPEMLPTAIPARSSTTPRCSKSMSWAGSWWPRPLIASCARPSIAPLRRAIRNWSSPPIRNCRTEYGNFATALLQQIHTRHSELELEQAQLSAEHGPNFPRVVEIRSQLEDLDAQKKAEDAKLVERFRSAWQTAADREQMVQEQPGRAPSRRHEAERGRHRIRSHAPGSQLQPRPLHARCRTRWPRPAWPLECESSNIAVVDSARQPVKPVAPNLPLYMAITFFAGLWLAVGGHS